MSMSIAENTISNRWMLWYTNFGGFNMYNAEAVYDVYLTYV